MHRFYSPTQNILSDTITLSDLKQIHHIKDVLRLKAKSELVIFDDQKNEYLASIAKIQAQKIVLKIKRKITPPVISTLKISVACAIPKKSRMDEIVDKLTQVGVERIIPLETERVIVKIARQKRAARIERWKRIALNACLQSQRKELPFMESIKGIGEVLADSAHYDLKLLFTLQGKRRALREILSESHPQNILVLIGPEGDFTEKEVILAERYGCLPVSLGNLVLRVDTACVAVVSMLNYALRTN
jgi:16S rRNA (uracil1498-N3)-methyltransferase